MNKFMKMAIAEAHKGIKLQHGGPFGSVIVRDGIVIAKAHNQVVKNNDPTCHGEINAIRKASKKLQTFDLTGCVLYTTGEPCPMCMQAIRWANIKEVYYGCNIEDTEKIGFRDLLFYNTSPEKYTEIEREECLKLYDEYLKIEKKTIY